MRMLWLSTAQGCVKVFFGSDPSQTLCVLCWSTALITPWLRLDYALITPCLTGLRIQPCNVTVQGQNQGHSVPLCQLHIQRPDGTVWQPFGTPTCVADYRHTLPGTPWHTLGLGPVLSVIRWPTGIRLIFGRICLDMLDKNINTTTQIVSLFLLLSVPWYLRWSWLAPSEFGQFGTPQVAFWHTGNCLFSETLAQSISRKITALVRTQITAMAMRKSHDANQQTNSLKLWIICSYIIQDLKAEAVT